MANAILPCGHTAAAPSTSLHSFPKSLNGPPFLTMVPSMPSLASLTAESLPRGRVESQRLCVRQQRLATVIVTATAGKGKEEEEPVLTSEEKLAALEAKFGTGKSRPRVTSPQSTPGAVAAASKAASRSSPPPPSATAASSPSPPPPPSATSQLLDRLLAAWLSKGGGLDALNDLSQKAIVALVIAWVVFRFIGPALGLYTLEDPLIQ